MAVPDPETDRAAVRGQPPLYFALPLAAAMAIERLVPLPDPFGAGRYVLAEILALVGIGFFVATVCAHRRAGNDPRPTSPAVTLITTGPYRFSRNPGYLGFLLLQSGIAIAADSAWALASVGVAMLLAHFLAVRPEEAYLERRFGEAYVHYRSRVRRWL